MKMLQESHDFGCSINRKSDPENTCTVRTVEEEKNGIDTCEEDVSSIEHVRRKKKKSNFWLHLTKPNFGVLG
jgi:hypothetical protein